MKQPYSLYKFYPAGFDRQQYWDDRYAREHIAGKSSDAFEQQGFWPVLQGLLQSEGVYLDAGCGIGGWVLFLKERGYAIKGIDTARRTLRALSEYDPELELKVAAMTAIPYADATFDGVLAIGTLEYLEDGVVNALQEAHRVLKPGGFIFIEVPLANLARRWFYLPLKRLERLIKRWQGRHATFANYLFTESILREQLGAAGFSVETVQPHEIPGLDSHYGLYVDWRIFRGKEPYQLNVIGRVVKRVAQALSPWLISTGIVVVAKKQSL